MKEYKQILAVSIFIYLIGCFMNSNMNISEWEIVSRYILGILMLIGGVCVVIKHDMK